ncbi:MAG: RNA polymerase sigma factor [Prolixibacteraceae bacterium]|nr:RNA polymerase sigma factor [Prolixibacteraceae bacterium]
MQNEDTQLIAELKQADRRESAFKKLVQIYQEKLYWHVRKMTMNHDDTDDILQNTFIKVWNNIENFREESTLYTWLYRIATNETITFINNQKKKNWLSINETTNYLMENLQSDPYFEGDKIQLLLQKAILTLPQKQRLVFNMRYFDEMKYEDMSKILNTSVGALKASYHHAAKKIEQYINDYD